MRKGRSLLRPLYTLNGRLARGPVVDASSIRYWVFRVKRMDKFSDELHGMIYPRARALTPRELYKEVLISVDSDAR